jgi:hypothetical protein
VSEAHAAAGRYRSAQVPDFVMRSHAGRPEAVVHFSPVHFFIDRWALVRSPQ